MRAQRARAEREARGPKSERDDGTSGVPPMCFSVPTSQPSILLWHVLEARAGERDLDAREHDPGRRGADMMLKVGVDTI